MLYFSVLKRIQIICGKNFKTFSESYLVSWFFLENFKRELLTCNGIFLHFLFNCPTSILNIFLYISSLSFILYRYYKTFYIILKSDFLSLKLAFFNKWLIFLTALFFINFPHWSRFFYISICFWRKAKKKFSKSDSYVIFKGLY